MFGSLFFRWRTSRSISSSGGTLLISKFANCFFSFESEKNEKKSLSFSNSGTWREIFLKRISTSWSIRTTPAPISFAVFIATSISIPGLVPTLFARRFWIREPRVLNRYVKKPNLRII